MKVWLEQELGWVESRKCTIEQQVGVGTEEVSAKLGKKVENILDMGHMPRMGENRAIKCFKNILSQHFKEQESGDEK